MEIDTLPHASIHINMKLLQMLMTAWLTSNWTITKLIVNFPTNWKTVSNFNEKRLSLWSGESHYEVKNNWVMVSASFGSFLKPPAVSSRSPWVANFTETLIRFIRIHGEVLRWSKNGHGTSDNDSRSLSDSNRHLPDWWLNCLCK